MRSLIPVKVTGSRGLEVCLLVLVIAVAVKWQVSELTENLAANEGGHLCNSTHLEQEHLLDQAPAAKVMDYLAGIYPDTQFTSHPTMSGFFVCGPSRDVLEMAKEMPNLDRVPEPPPPPGRYFYSHCMDDGRIRDYLIITEGDLGKLVSQLESQVPEADLFPEHRLSWLIVEADPESVMRVRELALERGWLAVFPQSLEFALQRRKELGFER